MSPTVGSPVAVGGSVKLAASAANITNGPFQLYKLSGAEISTIEAITFQVTTPTILDWFVQFRLELCNPNGIVLFQQLTPIFNFD